MAIVCLVFWGGGMSASAAEPAICPTCRQATLLLGKQHLGHWFETRTFTDAHGQSIQCHENHSIDREIIYCSRGCGIFWEGPEIETVTHTLPGCPYNK